MFEELNISDPDYVIKIDCSKKNIKSLQGINKFQGLTYLDCSENELSSLDVSNHTKLYYLSCYNNHLISLVTNPLAKNIQYLTLDNQTVDLGITPDGEIDLTAYDQNIKSVSIRISTPGYSVYKAGEKVFIKCDDGKPISVGTRISFKTFNEKYKYMPVTITVYCTINYDANGGEGIMNSSLVEGNQSLKLPKYKFAKEGYTFSGWNTAVNGEGDGYSDEGQIRPTDHTVLYAQWTANTYKVTLNGNKDSDSQLTKYTYGEGATLPTDWKKAGYTFDGWYDNAAFS